MILYNPTAAQSLNADIHAVPSVHIDNVQGTALVAFLAAQTGVSASITGVRLLTGQGDVTRPSLARGHEPGARHQQARPGRPGG